MGNISQKNWRAALREQRTFAQAIFDYSLPVFRFVQIVNISLISEHKMIIFPSYCSAFLHFRSARCLSQHSENKIKLGWLRLLIRVTREKWKHHRQAGSSSIDCLGLELGFKVFRLLGRVVLDSGYWLLDTGYWWTDTVILEVWSVQAEHWMRTARVIFYFSSLSAGVARRCCCWCGRFRFEPNFDLYIEIRECCCCCSWCCCYVAARRVVLAGVRWRLLRWRCVAAVVGFGCCGCAADCDGGRN